MYDTRRQWYTQIYMSRENEQKNLSSEQALLRKVV